MSWRDKWADSYDRICGLNPEAVGAGPIDRESAPWWQTNCQGITVARPQASFAGYADHPRHKWFGHGAVQDLSDLYGFFRACLHGRQFCEPVRDFPTYTEAAAEMVAMHERAFNGVIWC